MPKIVQNVSVILLIIYDLWVLPVVVFALSSVRTYNPRIYQIIYRLSFALMTILDNVGIYLWLGLIALFFILCIIYLKLKKSLALGYVMIVVVLYALAVFITFAAKPAFGLITTI